MRFHIGLNCINAKAILFDLDGTLVNSIDGILKVLNDWAIGKNLSPQQVLDYCHGKRTQDIVAHFIADPDQIQQETLDLTQKFLAAAKETRAIQGAQAFLEQLNQHQIPWAIVSSSENILIQARLNAVGLALPQVMISAEDVSAGKPNPEGYLKAAQLLNVSIEDCLIFEDSHTGIQAALATSAQLLVIGKNDLYACCDDYLKIQIN